MPTKPVKPVPNKMDLVLNGIPATGGGGAATNALSQMLGPGSNLRPYMGMGGNEYADQMDQMMMDPMNAWF